MIWICIVLGLLVVSQIQLWKTIKKDKEPKIEKGSIILKPLPEKVDPDSVEGVEEMLKEVIESVKSESWKVNATDFTSKYIRVCDINITSPDGKVVISSVLRYKNHWMSESDIRLVRFIISTTDKSGETKAYSFSNSKYQNDIIVFLWDFIIEKHLEENRLQLEFNLSNINEIRNNLTGIRRNRILNQLLDEEDLESRSIL